MKKVDICIIGCGRVANHYYKIIKKYHSKKFFIKAVCDIDLNKAKSYSKNYKSLFYTNLDLMIKKEKPKILFVLTPSGSHYQISKYALNRRINVLVEKPACMLPKQIIELDKLAKKNNKFFCVAFQNRLNPSIQLLKKNISRLGKIVSASIVLRWCRYQNYYNDDWHGSWLNDGGVINQQAIHHIDVMNYILGTPSHVISYNTKRLNKLEAEDTSFSIIKFPKKFGCTLELTTAARPRDYEASLNITGEKGRISIGGVAMNTVDKWEFIKPKKEDKDFRLYSQKVENGYGFSHSKILEGVYKKIINKKNNSFIVNAIDSLQTCNTVHAMYKSSEENKWIKVSSKSISKLLGK